MCAKPRHVCTQNALLHFSLPAPRYTADEALPEDDDYVSTEGDEWIPDKYDYDDEDESDDPDAAIGSAAASSSATSSGSGTATSSTSGSGSGTSSTAGSSSSGTGSSASSSGSGTGTGSGSGASSSGESSTFMQGSDDDVATTTRTENSVVVEDTNGADGLVGVSWAAATALTAVAAGLVL